MIERYWMKPYNNGEQLVGDDFNIEQIRQWYKEEEEAYANLSAKNSLDRSYIYENINNYYGLVTVIKKLIKNNKKIKVLCFGGAWGGEILTIEKIFKQLQFKNYEISVVDASETMLNIVKSELGVKIYKASIDGKLPIKNEEYDLVTCYGVLHHIPNVTFVLNELYRVLKKDGILHVREPISSLGNWTKTRVGLTKNERGLPINYFEDVINKLGFQVIKKKYAFCGPIIKIFSFFRLSIKSRMVIFIDSICSQLFSFNITYNRSSCLKKIAPSSIYVVLKK